MSTVLYAARKQLITMMKADLNMRLMIISSRMQRTSHIKDDLTTQKNSTLQTRLNNLIEELGEENVTYADIAAITNDTSDYDVQLQLLSIKDDDMDAEMQMINTKLQALSAEEEELDKAMDKAIKNEYGIFSKS